MHDVYPTICRVYHRTIACVFVSCVCYPKSYIQRDANPQIWKGRYHTHVLASESVEAVVNHEILFRWPHDLLLDNSKCFFLLSFVFYFESISANTYKCTWHETRTNNTNLHESCNIPFFLNPGPKVLGRKLICVQQHRCRNTLTIVRSGGNAQLHISASNMFDEILD